MTGSICTKYLGPTSTRGARIKAVSSGGTSITVPWDYTLNITDNHEAAAKALLVKINAGADYAAYRIDEVMCLPDFCGFAYAFPMRFTND